MRKVTISCDGCKSPSPLQPPHSGGVLDRTWLEMHVTHGLATYFDVAFCSTCKDNGPLLYRTMMRRIAEEERRVLEMQELIKQQELERRADA